MKARASLSAELVDGRTVVREMRSMAPLRLVPRRDGVVHLVSSVTAPLGGDDLELHVRVGPGARLELRGVAATLALPGHRPGGSRAVVRVEVDEGGSLDYAPEPTVITRRGCHEAVFTADLAAGARLRTRELLVLGRVGEPPGTLVSTLDVRRDGPLVRQTTKVGDPATDGSPAGLAGMRVLGTEFLCWGADVPEPVSHDWWSLVPLARGGSLATALAPDAVTAERALAEARRAHPGSSDHLTRSRTRFR
ncbi:urease accessory protein UreD [Actinosynnema sp. CA-248983]